MARDIKESQGIPANDWQGTLKQTINERLDSHRPELRDAWREQFREAGRGELTDAELDRLIDAEVEKSLGAALKAESIPSSGERVSEPARVEGQKPTPAKSGAGGASAAKAPIQINGPLTVNEPVKMSFADLQPHQRLDPPASQSPEKTVKPQPTQAQQGDKQATPQQNVQKPGPKPPQPLLQPLLTASSITLGEQARLEFDDLPDNGAESAHFLMRADQPIEGEVPALSVPAGHRYSHYALQMSGNELWLKGTSMGRHAGQLAAKGGASAAGQKALQVAIDRKDPKTTQAALGTDPDPLNTRILTLIGDMATPAELTKLANQLAPDVSGAAIRQAHAGVQQAGQAISARLSSQRTGIATGDAVSAGSFWLQYAHSQAEQKTKDKVPGFKADTNGYTLGADVDIHDEHTLGLAYTYAKGKSKSIDGARHHLDTRGHLLSLYGTSFNKVAFLDWRVGYGWADNDGRREIETDQQRNRMEANYDTRQWNLALRAGFPRPLTDTWSWVPELALNYVHLDVGDYQEKAVNGKDADRLRFDQVSHDTYEILEAGVGFRVLGGWEIGQAQVRPEVSLMGYHDFKEDPIALTAQYAAGGNLVVQGTEREKNRIHLGVATEIEVNHFSLTFRYGYDWMDSFTAHGLVAKVSYAF